MFTKVLRIIAFFSLMSLIVTIYDIIIILKLYSYNYNTIINQYGLMLFIEPVILSALIISGIFAFRYTPYFGVIFIPVWFIRPLEIIYSHLTINNNYSPPITWIGVISDLMVSILCIIAMLIFIKIQFTKIRRIKK